MFSRKQSATFPGFIRFIFVMLLACLLLSSAVVQVASAAPASSLDLRLTGRRASIDGYKQLPGSDFEAETGVPLLDDYE